jgi:hypothetical protein
MATAGVGFWGRAAEVRGMGRVWFWVRVVEMEVGTGVALEGVFMLMMRVGEMVEMCWCWCW